MKKLPKSYHVGQGYCGKRNKSIIARAHFPTNLSSDGILINSEKIKMYIKECSLIIDYEIKVNKTFYNNLSKTQFYITTMLELDVLPQANCMLYQLKYDIGHLLIKPISIYDAICFEVFDRKSKKKLAEYFQWAEEKFPYGQAELEKSRQIYIKDYINVISDKMFFDYESCIRRCISLLDFIFIQDKELASQNKPFFKKVLMLTARCRFGDDYAIDCLRWNIWVLYKVRNRIIHDGLHTDYGEKFERLCHNAIGTLQYLLQGCWASTQEEINYIVHLTQSYLLHGPNVEYHLDYLEKHINAMKEEKTPRFIKSGKELDKWVFDGLRYSDDILRRFGIDKGKDDYLEDIRR